MSVVTDKNGMLWIGTDDGLNSYDGYSVTNFFSRDHPGLSDDRIVRMVCDHKNRIWIQCGDGRLSVLDENRRFHEIDLTIDGSEVAVDYLMPVSKRPMFLFGGDLYGLRDDGGLEFGRVEMEHEPLLSRSFNRINEWGDDHLVFSGSDLMFLLDLRTLEVTSVVDVPNIVAAAHFNDDVALVTTSGENRLCMVSFSSGILKQFTTIKDQYGEVMHKLPGSIKRIHGDSFLITSPSAGVYIFDAKDERLIRYQNDVLNERTISTNHTSYIFGNSDGFNFIGSYGMGLDYFKMDTVGISSSEYFKETATSEIYKGYINCISEDGNGDLWMAGSNRLLKLDPTSGALEFHALDWSDEQDHRGGVRSIYFDKETRRIWIGLHNGLAVFDENLELLRRMGVEYGLPGNVVNHITKSPDGAIWISTDKGICKLDPRDFQIEAPGRASPLFWAQGRICNTIWFRNQNEAWVGTWDGALKVNFLHDDIQTYTTNDGLAFNEIIGFADDKNGTVYIGTRFGFHVLRADGAMRSFKTINDSWEIDCYSLVKDNAGDVWFSSNNFIARYSINEESFETFNDDAGVNPSGFRFFSAYASSNGELFFGCNKGITHFKPENIRHNKPSLKVLINEMTTLDSVYLIVPYSDIELPHYVQSVSFSFSAIDLLRGNNVFYRYQLEGVDQKWIKSSSGERITYSNLIPGDYVFSVNASDDGLTWVDALNQVTFTIATPWWEKKWFRISAVLAAAGMAAAFVRYRSRAAREQRESLETEKAINYLATSLHEQRNVEGILWDVAKNCIGHLRFEDCVIYTMDEERHVLVQRAAWGPKTAENDRIVSPIEIPLGKGIVGNVAKTGVAEIIRDTSKDERYIVDDAVRFSEIAVPIVYEGRVLGVIDSEHSRKGFFTQKHLSILTTIATLCAHKMVRAKAEMEKRKAQLEKLRHEREAMEAQLKSLRLQMNPHFLFNSLNAIQQMILAGEDRSATRYLSKFSRLLRLVLVHSDKETITLKEELETLNLYVELESLRFKESFHYNVVCDRRIDPEEIRVPVMLIQPFVENAIWHGLLHKKGDRHLKVEFCEGPAESIRCVIEDNGIGRAAAATNNNGTHTQKGIAVAEERLKTHNVHHGVENNIVIHDITDHTGHPAGTRVEIVLY